MKKLTKIFIITAFFTLCFALKPASAFAANFLFDPASATAGVGDTITVKVNVDTGGEDTNGVAAVVIYDSSLIEVSSIANGGFYSQFSTNSATAGKAVIWGNADLGFPKKGTGTVAILTLKTKTTGTAHLSFDCTGSDNPGIFKSDVNATNIMTCSANNTSTITIGTGGGTNPTPTTATSTTGTSGGTTPTQLPQTGIMDNLYKWAVPGAILVLIGGIFKFLL